MDFLRWLVFERILPDTDPGNLFVAFFLSLLFGTILTLALWPWFLPVTFLLIGIWGTFLYVIVSQWLAEMKEEWRRETRRDK